MIVAPLSNTATETSQPQTVQQAAVAELDDAPHPQAEDRPIPVPYLLCRFPPDVQRLLNAVDPALVTDPMYRRKLRKAISEDMAKYTM